MSDEFTITPGMSEESRKRAEQEALENAKRIVDELNKETEKPGDPDEKTT